MAGDPRFRSVGKDRRRIVYLWATREFKNLQRAEEAGVPAPRPIDVENNVLVMGFVGEDGIPYPRMKERPPSDPERTFRALLNAVESLYKKGGLVHADLSEYNVLMGPEPVLVDFSMATDVKNLMADEFLLRDLTNLTNYFRKLGVRVQEPKELFRKIKGNHNPFSNADELR